MAASAPLFNTVSAGEILDKYPLHWHVWNNNNEKLDELLTTKLHDKELQDPHGRTPLQLAITLGYSDSVHILLKHNCDASSMSKEGWTATQEAVGTGDIDLLKLIIQHREYQRLTQKNGGVSEILELLDQADDFYVEMKWEFNSWVPLLSRMCPSDSYKIWKSGANVRVDTTLKGFDQMNWQRGKQSFIFKGGTRSSTFFEIDHEKQCYWKESVIERDESVSLESLHAPPSVISLKMTNPNVATALDHEQISFSRQKSGILGWGGEKTDNINGYDCKVFSVSGVELVTRTRTEHMTAEDRQRLQDEKKRAQSNVPAFLNILEPNEKEEIIPQEDIVDATSTNPFNLSLEDYFNPKVHTGKDVGRLRTMTSKSTKFSATIAICDSFPLSLQDQVLPIINLMANSSSHFAKLRDFITLQLPAGFPIKIEIPLFHVLNARVTFANLNGSETCPDGVIVLEEDVGESEEGASSVSKKTRCVIDKSIFEVHQKYKDLGADMHAFEQNGPSFNEEDEMLQLAIQKSLLELDGSDVKGDQATESGELSLMEALNSSQNNLGSTQRRSAAGQQSWVGRSREDDDLQRAIRESLSDTAGADTGGVFSRNSSFVNDETFSPTRTATTDSNTDSESADALSEEEQLKLIMELSKQEQEKIQQDQDDEEEQLRKILELSLVDK